MALPREPRQKMINIMYLVLTAILALNVSAEILEAFKTVDKSLQNSSTNLSNANSSLYESLTEKLKDEKYKDQAAKWQPKAEEAKKLSADMMTYIEGLKVELKKNADLVIKEDGSESFKEDNLDASTRLFEVEKKGDDLKKKLDEYKIKMLAIDSSFAGKFGTNFPVNTDPIVTKEGKKDFTLGYFHMTPVVAALTMLSKFQNNVKNAENLIVNECHSKIGSVEYVYNQFQPIIGTSSTYLMPGEDLEVTAGIGSFSSAAAPIITINGQSQAADANGVAIKKFKVNGSGSVRVVINFKKPDGSPGTVEKDIPYTVGQPSSAAISLDKMNVFYVGLDNPITIGSPTGMEKTGVSGNNCTINGSGPKRTVKVSGTGTCSITVSPQGSTPLTMEFRIKRIPEPSFMVGSGKARMPSVDFKNQQYCRADMGPDFIYDVRYSVVSATVYFAGANFANVVTASITGNGLSNLSSYIQRCGPGSVVSFDNIKVSGPDGIRIIEPKSFALY
ncbi:MAG: gliding motility protein GldM [Ferruginibacter sp.]